MGGAGSCASVKTPSLLSSRDPGPAFHPISRVDQLAPAHTSPPPHPPPPARSATYHDGIVLAARWACLGPGSPPRSARGTPTPGTVIVIPEVGIVGREVGVETLACRRLDERVGARGTWASGRAAGSLLGASLGSGPALGSCVPPAARARVRYSEACCRWRPSCVCPGSSHRAALGPSGARYARRAVFVGRLCGRPVALCGSPAVVRLRPTPPPPPPAPPASAWASVGDAAVVLTPRVA